MSPCRARRVPSSNLHKRLKTLALDLADPLDAVPIPHTVHIPTHAAAEPWARLGLSHASGDIRAHIGMVASASQKLHVDERREDSLGCDMVEAPQSLNLPFRQRQTGNLEILSAYELKPAGDVRFSCLHMCVLAEALTSEAMNAIG